MLHIFFEPNYTYVNFIHINNNASPNQKKKNSKKAEKFFVRTFWLPFSPFSWMSRRNSFTSDIIRFCVCLRSSKFTLKTTSRNHKSLPIKRCFRNIRLSTKIQNGVNFSTRHHFVKILQILTILPLQHTFSLIHFIFQNIWKFVHYIHKKWRFRYNFFL